MAFNSFLLLKVICTLVTSIDSQNLELQFVAVVFRHGDRAPDKSSEMFPNDPYINDDFYPMGLGGLNNNGKRRLYNLGEFLRERYNDFLGNLYYPNIVMGRSTDYERTIMSLQLVLAALFPPKTSEIWNPSLNWQPIPVNVVPSVNDNLLVAELCPQYREELDRVLQLPEVEKEVDEFRPFMQNLTDLTGKEINTTYAMYNIYHTFVAESSMDLPLPTWAEKMFPNGQLLDGIVLEYQISNYNKKLRRLYGGMLLRNILETMIGIANNGTNNGRKINLFSGHETNIASVLNVLDVYKPHVPEYGSAVIFELFTDGNDYYVKFQYYLGIPPTLTELSIPGCSDPCPLNEFLVLMEDMIPSDDEMICPKTETYQ